MNLEAFAERLKNRRIFCRMTQSELAEALGVTPQSISKWERARAVPDIDNLIELSRILRVTVDALVCDEDEKRVFLAIDGGGTKTEFVLFSEDGHIIRHARTGSTNINAVGEEKAVSELIYGIDRVLCKERPEWVFAGISGSSLYRNAEILKEAVQSRIAGVPVKVSPDILNVIHSCRGAEKCIAVICGTGSCVFAYDGEKLERFGGWGYLFGDAGSGYDIGREVLRECFAYEDGFGRDSIVTELVEKKLGGRALNKLHTFYTGGRDTVAAFAPLAFEAARAGDTVAKEIIERSVSKLSELIAAADNGSDTVIVSGGLTSNRDIIEPILKARISQKSKLVFPTLPQIYGAALATMKFAGFSASAEEFDKNFTEDYKRITDK